MRRNSSFLDTVQGLILGVFFREEYGDHPALCCDDQQVNDILTNFKQAEAILGRCPTCYYNFRVNFCDMTCRPDQSKFLNPEVIEGNFTECYISGPAVSKKYNPGDRVKMVNSLEYHMSHDTKQKIYDSCKDVLNPATSQPAIKMMCGVWGADCTPERFFSSLGDVNAFAPFQIDYVFGDPDNHQIDGFTPLQKNIRSCNEVVPGETKGCSCSDCELACDIPDFPDTNDQDFVIVDGVDGVTFIMVIIFVVGSIIFLAIVLGSSVLKNNVLLCKYNLSLFC